MNPLLPVLAVPLLGVLAVIPLAHGVSVNMTYTYDAIGRLTKADYSTGQAFQYTFDKAGNLSRVAYTNTTVTSAPKVISISAKATPVPPVETLLGAKQVLNEDDLPPVIVKVVVACLVVTPLALTECVRGRAPG